MTMKLDKSAPGFVIVKPNHDFGDSSPFRLAPALKQDKGPDLVWIEWEQLDYLKGFKRKKPLLTNPRLLFFEGSTVRWITPAWQAGLNPTDRFLYQLNLLVPKWHSKAAERGVDHPKPYATCRYSDFFQNFL